MSRIAEPVLKRIYELYVPRTEDGDARPDVLWVGPFIDGIVQYVAEVFPVLWRNADHARNPATHRAHMKTLIFDSGRNRYGERAIHVDELQIAMRRAEWPLAPSGVPLTVYLTDRPDGGIVNQEFGELRNSPQIVPDPETGLVVLRDRKGQPCEPIILEDKRYGLHYLLVGDEIDFTWKQRGQPARMQFKLRPRSEGSSLLTAERQMDAVII